MSLSELETAVVEYVGDAIVNDCGRPAPTKIMRYHGPMPDACCTDDGVLSISWEPGYPSKQFPSRAAVADCVGPPIYVLVVRYVVCWPGLDVAPGSVILPDDAWDAEAAMLADVADCVTRALMRLSCDPALDDPFVAAVFAQVPRKMIGWSETSYIRPSGLCAGVTWKVYAALRSGVTAS